MFSPIVDRICAEIRLREGAQIAVGSLESLRDEYDKIVTDANRRLADCLGLIRRGLRTEAVTFAKQPPGLIAYAESLEFPDLQLWLDILLLLGIPTPALINGEALDQVKVTLDEHQPLEVLLVRQRQLAIGRAPLSWRLRILRAIRAAEPSNPVWVEDLKNWEAVRIREIEREFDRREDEANLQSMKGILEELTKTEWVTTPSPTLLHKVKNRLTRLEDGERERKFEGLLEPLRAAFARGDEDAGAAKYEEWENIAAGMDELRLSQLQEKISSELQWAKEIHDWRMKQANFATSCEQFRLELANQKPLLGKLENGYQQLRKYGLPIPADVTEKYQALKSKAHVRRMLGIGAISMIVMTCLGSGATYWWFQARQNRFDTAKAIAIDAAEKKLQSVKTRIDEEDFYTANRNLPNALAEVDQLKLEFPSFDSQQELRPLEDKRDAYREAINIAITRAEETKKKILDFTKQISDSLSADGKSVENADSLWAQLKSKPGTETKHVSKLLFDNAQSWLRKTGGDDSLAAFQKELDLFSEECVKLDDFYCNRFIARVETDLSHVKQNFESGDVKALSEHDARLQSLSKEIATLKGGGATVFTRSKSMGDSLAKVESECEGLVEKVKNRYKRSYLDDLFERKVKTAKSLQEYHSGLGDYLKDSMVNQNKSESISEGYAKIRQMELPSVPFDELSGFLRSAKSLLNAPGSSVDEKQLQKRLETLNKRIQVGNNTLIQRLKLFELYLKYRAVPKESIGAIKQELSDSKYANLCRIQYRTRQSDSDQTGYFDSKLYNEYDKQSDSTSPASKTAVKLQVRKGGEWKETSVVVQGSFKVDKHPQKSFMDIIASVERLLAQKSDLVEGLTNLEKDILERQGLSDFARLEAFCILERELNKHMPDTASGSEINSIDEVLDSNDASQIRQKKSDLLAIANRRLTQLKERKSNAINAIEGFEDYQYAFVGAVRKSEQGGFWLSNPNTRVTGDTFALKAVVENSAIKYQLVPIQIDQESKILRSPDMPPEGSPLLEARASSKDK